MDNRRSKENYYLDIAEAALERSTCLRRQFGAIIVRDDEIVATGYNGAPRGRRNCSDLGRCTRRELNIPAGEQALEIVRLRLADDMPVMLETNRFPASYGWLMDADLSGSLYALLAEKDVEPKQAVHDISLCHATPAQAKLLAVDSGEALLCLREAIYDQNGHPLHTSLQLIRGDRFTFRI